MSRNKKNDLPWIRYDFSRVADRRHEQRQGLPGELYFRDVPVGDTIMTWFSAKIREKN